MKSIILVLAVVSAGAYAYPAKESWEDNALDQFTWILDMVSSTLRQSLGEIQDYIPAHARDQLVLAAKEIARSMIKYALSK